MACADIAKSNHFIFLQNDGLPDFLLNSFVQLRASKVFLFSEARGKPSGIFPYIIHFVDTQFPENLSVFPWHQNYGFCRDREMKSFYFSPKWRSSGLPIECFCVTAGFQRSSYCVKLVEVRMEYFICNTFCRWSVSRNLSVFPWHKNYGFSRYREMKSFYFSPKWRSSGLPIEFFCVTAGFQRSSYCVKPVEVRLAFFYIIHFVDIQFLENLSVFPLHQNYGFCRDREMKSFYFSPNWRSSGLPIEFFSVTAGFQRSSYCVKTVEVRLAFSFNLIHSVATQFRENLSVFPWHQNYGFCRDREMNSFHFSPKSRSSGLPIQFSFITAGFQCSSYCLKPVEVRLAFFLYNTFCRYSVSRKS